MLNLGKHFDVDTQHWPLLVKRIEQLVQGDTVGEQTALFDLTDQADAGLEKAAQRYAALIIHKFSQSTSSQPITDQDRTVSETSRDGKT